MGRIAFRNVQLKAEIRLIFSVLSYTYAVI